MGQVATNTKQQIERLKERGMILDYDESKVKEFLLDIGYYRLGFYWNPFETDTNHNFIEGTKFSEIIKLYYLDVDLRNILLRYINRIEINFRTKVVYYVSNKNKQSPTWFIDPNVVHTSCISYIEKLYDFKFKKNHRPIKNHHKNYINDRYAPAWKTLEFFTFGTVLNIFRDIKDNEIKERISKEFGVLNLNKFMNLMETVVLVRNTCAHGDVLFDFNTPKGISVIPTIEFNNNDRSSLDSCIKLISYLLGQISSNRQVEMDHKISEILRNAASNETLKKIIEEKINYKF